MSSVWPFACHIKKVLALPSGGSGSPEGRGGRRIGMLTRRLQASAYDAEYVGMGDSGGPASSQGGQYPQKRRSAKQCLAHLHIEWGQTGQRSDTAASDTILPRRRTRLCVHRGYPQKRRTAKQCPVLTAKQLVTNWTETIPPHAMQSNRDGACGFARTCQSADCGVHRRK